MRRFYNYRDLYRHVVTSFYLGEYKKNDRFPTQMELTATYKVAANSIKKVFRMLREDGFITTDRSFGTHVTFDVENPEHLAKVALFHPDPNSTDTETLLLPSRFAAYTIFHGLQIATPRQISQYLADIQALLDDTQQRPDAVLPAGHLLLSICRDLDNTYLSDIANFLHHEYVFVNSTALQDSVLYKKVRAMTAEFYADLKQVLLDRQYSRVINLVCRHYQALYRIPNLLVFSILEGNRKLFAQQALYAQLVHQLFLSIIAKDMKKGDLLPTESEIAEQYGVSPITVRKASSMLKEIGLIDSERFVGTHMAEDWNSPKVQDWLSNLLERQHKQIADAIFAEYVIGRALFDYTAQRIPDALVDTMEKLLETQWVGYEKYNLPLFMSEVFITPLISHIDSPLLTTFYHHVHEDLTKFLGMRLLQMSKGFTGTSRVHLYATRAIAALRRKDDKIFLSEVDAAVLLNWELLRSALENTIYECLKHNKDIPNR